MGSRGVEDPELLEEIRSFLYYLYLKSTDLLVWPPNKAGRDSPDSGAVRLSNLYNEQPDLPGIHYRAHEIEARGAGADVYIRTVEESEVNRVVDELSLKCGLDLRQTECFYGFVQADVMCSEKAGIAMSEAQRIHEAVLSLEHDNALIDGKFRLVRVSRSRLDDFTGRERLCKKGYQRVSFDHHYLIARIQ